jgi:hypothetical protein
MKYLMLLSVVFLLGCGGSSENTLVPNNLSSEEVQKEIEANQAIETPPTSSGGV